MMSGVRVLSLFLGYSLIGTCQRQWDTLRD